MVWDGATWDRAPGNILSGQFIQGDIAHDSPVNATTNPLLLGGRAQAAAPTAVSLDGDAVRAWFLLNGAQATVITAAGNLIGGDVANGLDVDVTRVTGTVTVDSELPAAAALTDNFATPTAPAVGAFAMVYDGATWDFLRGTAVDGALVNLGANNDVTVTGAVDTELPAAAALTDAFANPTAPAVGAFMMGWNGATWDKVDTANTGRLQVDVVTGGGTDTPTNPVNSWDTTAAVAAGATDNHDHTDVGGTTKKLSQVHAGSSVAMKCDIQSVINGVGTTIGVFFTPAGGSYTWKPPHRNYASVAFSANAGYDGFRVIRTNLDSADAADVYSNIFYED
jgi:hypothetical protein